MIGSNLCFNRITTLALLRNEGATRGLVKRLSAILLASTKNGAWVVVGEVVRSGWILDVSSRLSQQDLLMEQIRGVRKKKIEDDSSVLSLSN